MNLRVIVKLRKVTFLTICIFFYFCAFCIGQTDSKRQWVIDTIENEVTAFQVLKLNPEIKDGDFIKSIILNDSIFPIIEGYYINNFKDGKWTIYSSPTSMNEKSVVKLIINYRFGLKNGEYLVFNKRQDTIVNLEYINDVRVDLPINPSTIKIPISRVKENPEF